MKYNITIAYPHKNHSVSQLQTWTALHKAGFLNMVWRSGLSIPGDSNSYHEWSCEGNSEDLVTLKLSIHVRKVEEAALIN